MTAHQDDRIAGNGKRRRQAKTSGPVQPRTTTSPSKLDRLVTLLTRPEGACLAELTAATGWQTHSVRGALAGSLKKKGHVVLSEKIDGTRRYRVGAAQ